jgi:hypothetical protein
MGEEVVDVLSRPGAMPCYLGFEEFASILLQRGFSSGVLVGHILEV